MASYCLDSVGVATPLKKGDTLTLGGYCFRLLRIRDKVLIGYDFQENIHIALFTSDYIRLEKYWDTYRDVPLTTGLSYLFGDSCKKGDLVAFMKNSKWYVIECCGEE